MGYSPPGSSVHGILQARILEWVATPSSRRSSHLSWGSCTSVWFFTAEPQGKPFYGWSEVQVTQSCLILQPMDCPWDSPGQNTGVGSLSLLQGIFPTWGSNPGLPHCKRILLQLNHPGSPRILEWVAYPFSRGSSRPRNRTGVSCIAGYQLSYQGSPFYDWGGPNLNILKLKWP